MIDRSIISVTAFAQMSGKKTAPFRAIKRVRGEKVYEIR